MVQQLQPQAAVCRILINLSLQRACYLGKVIEFDLSLFLLFLDGGERFLVMVSLLGEAYEVENLMDHWLSLDSDKFLVGHLISTCNLEIPEPGEPLW